MAIQTKFPSTQDWVDNNGCGGFNNHMYFNLQQQQQRQKLQSTQHQQQSNNTLQDQSFFFDGCNIPGVSLKNSASMFNHQSIGSFFQSMPTHDLKFDHEIDHCLKLQSERLRLVIEEQRKREVAMLVKAIESQAQLLIRQKEEAISQASKKRLELENFLIKLETENQKWQRIAQENEAMVVSLNNTIEQLREKDNGQEDAESCCEVNREEETTTAQYGNNYNNNMGFCRLCESRNSCVLFLPCRHLCCCKDCEVFLENCPVCQSPKKATIQALMV